MAAKPEQPERERLAGEYRPVAQETLHDQETPTRELTGQDSIAELSAADRLQAQGALDFLSSVKAAMAAPPVVPPAEDDLPEYIGRYKILRSLGRGGFSEVFLGADESLQRRVAIKVPLVVGGLRSEYRVRFEREAMAAALLNHPNIVPIYEFDVIGPLAFIAYRWLPGKNLAQLLQERQESLDCREAAEIVAQLAEAIEHAHQRGVIHRDLKPANVLVDESPTRLPDPLAARTMVTDFGLAQYQGNDDQKLTREGSTLGTPAYMSPEQAAGATDITAASDVYSLGVMFYELLIGKVPFKKETVMATLQAVQTEAVPPLNQSGLSIPLDLEAICLKCLQKSPLERYRSAFELSADLRNWLAGFPVKARRPGMLDRTWAWAKRNPTVATLTTLVVVLFVAGLAGTTWQWQLAQANAEQYRREYDRAEVSRVQAEEAAEKEQQQRVRAEKIASFLGATYRSADPARDGRAVKVVEILARAEQEIALQFADDNLTRWSLWLQLARAWISLAQYNDAQRVLEFMNPEIEAAELDPNAYTIEYWEIASLIENGLGRYDRSLQSVKKAIEQAEQVPEISPRVIWRLKLNAASQLSNMGEFAEANLIRLEAVSYYRNNPDASAEEIWEAELDWIVGLTQTSQHELAQQELIALVPQLEESLGPDHSTMLLAKAMLAKTLIALRKSTDQLIPLHEEILEMTLQKYGDKHSESLRAMHNLATLLTRSQRHTEAHDYFQRAATLAIDVHGSDSPYRAVMLIELAKLERDAGNWQDACEHFSESVQSLRGSIGPLHARTMDAWIEWLDLLEAGKSWKEADAGWQEIYQLEQEKNGGGTLLAQIALFRQGLLAIAQGDSATGLRGSIDFLAYLDQQTSLANRDLLILKSHLAILGALLPQTEIDAALSLADRYCELALGPATRPFDPLLAQTLNAAVKLDSDRTEDVQLHLQRMFAAEVNLEGMLYSDKQTCLRGLQILLDPPQVMVPIVAPFHNQLAELVDQVEKIPDRFK